MSSEAVDYRELDAQQSRQQPAWSPSDLWTPDDGRAAGQRCVERVEAILAERARRRTAAVESGRDPEWAEQQATAALKAPW